MDVLNLIVKQNIVNASVVVKLAENNVLAESVRIRNRESMFSLTLTLVVNVENLVVQKNIANVFRMVKNVDLSVNALIVVMGNEFLKS